MDEVLLVASSRSFGAVNREQFYVSISRGRERCHVFTDDAELLAHRVMDSHNRTAAVELVALRQELAQLGFVPEQKEMGKDTTAGLLPTDRGEDSDKEKETTRQHRPMRETRATRLSPAQRLANLVEGVRRWLGIGSQEAIELSGQLQRGEVAKPVQQTERVSRDWKLAPERQPNRSRGMHI